MYNHKFKIKQNVFVLPVKMPGVIKKHIKQSAGENIYEVGVKYQDRIWKAKFYESELSDLKKDLS